MEQKQEDKMDGSFADCFDIPAPIGNVPEPIPNKADLKGNVSLDFLNTFDDGISVLKGKLISIYNDAVEAAMVKNKPYYENEIDALRKQIQALTNQNEECNKKLGELTAEIQKKDEIIEKAFVLKEKTRIRAEKREFMIRSLIRWSINSKTQKAEQQKVQNIQRSLQLQLQKTVFYQWRLTLINKLTQKEIDKLKKSHSNEVKNIIEEHTKSLDEARSDANLYKLRLMTYNEREQQIKDAARGAFLRSITALTEETSNIFSTMNKINGQPSEDASTTENINNKNDISSASDGIVVIPDDLQTLSQLSKMKCSETLKNQENIRECENGESIIANRDVIPFMVGNNNINNLASRGLNEAEENIISVIKTKTTEKTPTVENLNIANNNEKKIPIETQQNHTDSGYAIMSNSSTNDSYSINSSAQLNQQMLACTKTSQPHPSPLSNSYEQKRGGNSNKTEVPLAQRIKSAVNSPNLYNEQPNLVLPSQTVRRPTSQGIRVTHKNQAGEVNTRVGSTGMVTAMVYRENKSVTKNRLTVSKN